MEVSVSQGKERQSFVVNTIYKVSFIKENMIRSGRD